MNSITKVFPHSLGLSACYRQWRAKSHCKFLHGYSLQFEVHLCADELDDCGWVYDFGEFKSLMSYLRATFDHCTLVALDDPQLGDFRAMEKEQLIRLTVVERVGTEAFAKMVFDMMNTILRESGMNDRVYVSSVTCQEHEGNKAIYWGD